MRLLALASVMLSAATPATAQPTPLTEAHRTDLRCAAAFAIVALEQSDGDALEGWPPLAVRGKRFFADTGERVMKEAGISRDAVRDAIAGEVRSLQTAADPDAALTALARPCLARLDASVPPLKVPDLKQCAAIMALAVDEVHAREGMSAAAKDLKTLASVLASREREALVAAGRSGDEADRTLAEAREAMAAEAADGAGGVDKYDIAHCYDLAKPNEKSHY
ncbi:hypothetical protein Saro_3327 [Novosphingobium aromaticivorans DSM 12444]|uniref:Uncharacterized protein n=2 Tax=Novosphingobium aromaticivorans TaxID=48935 RepID=Q2G311_NOVAD|nr:hypothetical protein Saro_3327 [Novosphingobium aromaticivorans DSM 12444]